MADLLHKEITGAIIGAYYEVYNHTGRTYPEYIYERAMMEELRQRGYPTTQQDEYKVFYKERLVGLQRLDLFVVDEVVVENKAVEKLSALNRAQGLSYLKTTGKTVGLLLNFGSDAPEFDRLYFDPAKRNSPVERTEPPEAQPSADWIYPELAYAIMGALYEVHSTLGPGYIQRIYANACHYEFGLSNLAPMPAKRMQVTYKGNVIGDIAFNHIVVEGKIMIFPVARRDIASIHLDSLKDWLRTREIKLGIVANFDAVRLQTVFVRV
jgi:GxxExxY protein